MIWERGLGRSGDEPMKGAGPSVAPAGGSRIWEREVPGKERVSERVGESFFQDCLSEWRDGRLDFNGWC
jgi:hypothetical protein